MTKLQQIEHQLKLTSGCIKRTRKRLDQLHKDQSRLLTQEKIEQARQRIGESVAVHCYSDLRGRVGTLVKVGRTRATVRYDDDGRSWTMPADRLDFLATEGERQLAELNHEINAVFG